MTRRLAEADMYSSESVESRLRISSDSEGGSIAIVNSEKDENRSKKR